MPPPTNLYRMHYFRGLPFVVVSDIMGLSQSPHLWSLHSFLEFGPSVQVRIKTSVDTTFDYPMGHSYNSVVKKLL